MRINLVLDNTQSVARDHLANERTFLAWLRTSLTFASAGVALTQLFRIQSLEHDGFAHTTSAVVGSLFIAAGICVLIMGTFRYFHVQEVLQHGRFPVPRIGIWFTFLVTVALVILAFSVLLKISVP
ncbi:hypothetical protein DASB73_041230 [Starmerella bacillaris]|uniref:DUF202 domain-containing protein n=1 Tax=Starmerella bacillaris TaxID=1247836 RepID=A0AAV5RNZ6_STABA|nr:hypothetical protein DASB73_041230 [Starmerella bacillaris]